jgi:hypothetical protein
MGEMSVYEAFVGKHERKRRIGRPRRRWECNIKMNLRELLLWALEWIHLAIAISEELL